MHVKNAKPGKYSDGDGLWLHKRADGGGQWFYRYERQGKRREMGLGSTRHVSLKEARDTAGKWRTVFREGKDPMKERDRMIREATKADHTLRSVALEAFEARKAELKGDGKNGRWFSALELHVLPYLGDMPIEEIDQQDIKKTLSKIWHTKSAIAKKAMDRLGIVMRHAAAMGLDVDLQATIKARELLGKSRHKVKHVPALPWQDVPSFYASLDEGSITHLALRLLILTTVRSKPIRFCHLNEIEGDTWVVPGEKMKGDLEFRVPLSIEAQSVIEEARKFAKDGHLFPSVRKGVISDATMSRYMERLKIEARPHGFRSSFRDWCAEATDTPREIAETVLAHSTGGKVELSYRRTDYLDKRRVLMERWANHVTKLPASIIPIFDAQKHE